jgi:hypothetical protein
MRIVVEVAVAHPALLFTVAVVLAHTLQLFQLCWKSIASSKADV